MRSRNEWGWSTAAFILAVLLSFGLEQAAAPPASLTTVAYRVHNMPEMISFYSEAFGADFREVDTGGITSQFGEIGPLTLKFVPIRAEADFENFPIHQLGFEVADLGAVLDAAKRHGGRIQNEPEQRGERLHAAVRDPDGNTIEVYGPQ